MSESLSIVSEKDKKELVVSKPKKSQNKYKFKFRFRSPKVNQQEKQEKENVPLKLKVAKFTRNGLLKIDILNGDQYKNAKESTRRLLPADEKLDKL